MYYADEQDIKTPYYKWLRDNKYVNYDNIPKLLELLEQYIGESKDKYRNRQAALRALEYVTDVVKHYKLENDLYLVQEYYDKLLSHKAFNKLSVTYYSDHLNILLFINDLPNGKELLKNHGVDFSKYGKYREAAFNNYLNGGGSSYYNTGFNIEKLQQFVPKELDAKKILDKKVTLYLCIFLTNNNVEIPHKTLCQLANQIYSASVSDDYRTNNLYHENNLVDKFTNMLLKNSNFVNFIASRSNLNLGIYYYFDKVFPIPKELDMDELEKAEQNKFDPNYKYRIIFNNEFSRKLYSNPGYKYINLNTKMTQKVNLKLSGTKFVTPEEQEENLKKQAQIDQEERPTTKRLKV